MKIIGSAALMLQADYERGTKDSDVLETAQITLEIKERLLALAGKGTDISKRFRLHLDVVANGLPFLPQKPLFHEASSMSRRLRHFDVKVLDIADVVVSKLKRFNANDVSDVAAMIASGHAKHGRVLERFKSAVDAYSTDARAEDLPKYVKNLNTIERDFFRVTESKVDLPDWI